MNYSWVIISISWANSLPEVRYCENLELHEHASCSSHQNHRKMLAFGHMQSILEPLLCFSMFEIMNWKTMAYISLIILFTDIWQALRLRVNSSMVGIPDLEIDQNSTKVWSSLYERILSFIFNKQCQLWNINSS